MGRIWRNYCHAAKQSLGNRHVKFSILAGVHTLKTCTKFMLLPEREPYLYHASYCEENIWHLCQHHEFAQSQVIVIAAQAECFPMLYQRAARSAQEPLLWDYHVVLLWQNNSLNYLLDFDTRLGFCTPLEEYMQQSFLADKLLYPEYIPLFRLISAQEYVRYLKSDRRHMQTPEGWLAPPPPWPPISENESNLHQFTNTADHSYGKVLSAATLLETFKAI